MSTETRDPKVAEGPRTAAGRDVLGPRFWSKVDDTGECWVWTGVTMDGYGQYFALGQSRLAHRLAYETLVGPIPDGLTLDHLCRNRACVNPAHLEPVTNRGNILRGESPSAIHARQETCLRGHPFTPENTYIKPSNKRQSSRRQCRTCRAEERRQRTARDRRQYEQGRADALTALRAEVEAFIERVEATSDARDGMRAVLRAIDRAAGGEAQP